MEQDTLNDHYKKLASKYDQSFSASSSSTGYNFAGQAGARTIIDLMKIRREDRVVDLGAGTCETAGFKIEIDCEEFTLHSKVS